MLKVSAWAFWILSAATAAYIFSHGFSFLLVWAMVNLMFIANRLWIGAARDDLEALEKEQRKEIPDERTTEEPRGD